MNHAEGHHCAASRRRLELVRIAALNKEAVRIVALGQRHGAHVYALLAESADKRLCRLLATAVPIGIKGQVDGSRTVAELAELARIEIGTHRAGDVAESRPATMRRSRTALRPESPLDIGGPGPMSTSHP